MKKTKSDKNCCMSKIFKGNINPRAKLRKKFIRYEILLKLNKFLYR